MSQHTCLAEFTSTKGKVIEVDVLMGWDQQLQQQFLVVEVLDFETVLDEDDLPEIARETANVSEGLVYSNLNDEFTGKDLPYFRNKLSELGIKVPDSMFEECEADQKANVGEREMFHEVETE